MSNMLKLCLKSFPLFVFFLFLFSCSTAIEPDQQKAVDDELNRQVSKIMAIYSKALNSDDPALVGEFQNALREFDATYHSSLAKEFNKTLATSRLGGSTSWDPLTDLPLNTDGAVYLSGGGDGAVSTIVRFVSPKSSAGKYYHGAILDLDKFDPSNLDSQCFQTAVTKGAGYETPNIWMRNANVAVFNPKASLNQTALNNAQVGLDYYCAPSNTNMQYGFFKDYVDLSSIVTKEDNYYWYCTKVAWRVYKQLGIDIDSNALSMDAWKASGLYSLVDAYYSVRYFYNSSLARQKKNEYMNNAVNTIVHAEEIYTSPVLNRVYEKIRVY